VAVGYIGSVIGLPPSFGPVLVSMRGSSYFALKNKS